MTKSSLAFKLVEKRDEKKEKTKKGWKNRNHKLELRPIFVMYAYKRFCYNNPSWNRFETLPSDIAKDVLNRMKRKNK